MTHFFILGVLADLGGFRRGHRGFNGEAVLTPLDAFLLDGEEVKLHVLVVDFLFAFMAQGGLGIASIVGANFPVLIAAFKGLQVCVIAKVIQFHLNI